MIPPWANLANAVRLVGDVEIAGCIHRNPLRSIQQRLRSGTAITGEARDSIASHSRDNPSGADLADAVIKLIGNVNVSGCIRRHATWVT